MHLLYHSPVFYMRSSLLFILSNLKDVLLIRGLHDLSALSKSSKSGDTRCWVSLTVWIREFLLSISIWFLLKLFSTYSLFESYYKPSVMTTLVFLEENLSNWKPEDLCILDNTSLGGMKSNLCSFTSWVILSISIFLLWRLMLTIDWMLGFVFSVKGGQYMISLPGILLGSH